MSQSEVNFEGILKRINLSLELFVFFTLKSKTTPRQFAISKFD